MISFVCIVSAVEIIVAKLLVSLTVSGMALKVQEHVKLTADDFHDINKIISNHRFHKAEDPTTSLSQAFNEEFRKILSRPENQGRRVTHETLFQPPGKGIQPPLFEAVRHGCMKSLLYFFTRFGDVIDFASATSTECTFLSSSSLRYTLHYCSTFVPSLHDYSILSAACHIRYRPERCIEIVETLISRGASVNSCDCYNHTPLMEAAGVANLEVLKYLVEQGSVIDACDKGGCTALFDAASRRNSVSAIRFLVSKGASITHRSELGYTALHFAAFQGSVEAVKELLALGASPEFLKVDSLKCDYVPPPLLLAAARRQREVVDAFLEHPECTTELRIDALLLLGCGKYVDQYEWREALTLREKCLAAVQFLPPSEAFGGRTEMRTVADLNAVMTSEADMQYQSWIIRERCIGQLEPNEVLVNESCLHALELFTSSQYSEAEMFVKHVLKKLLSLVQRLPPEMRVYELNHSGVSILNYSLICINDIVPEVVEVTNGKGPHMTLFVEFSLRCLEFIADAAKCDSCKESQLKNHNLSHIVSATLEIFAHWYNQQVVRNTTKTSDDPFDREYGSLLHQFVSACLSQSQYIAILHDAVDCKARYIAEVVRSVLECGGNSIVNAFDKRGRRPLHVAALSGKHELVSLFLEFGAHVDAVNREGSSAAEVVGRNNTAIIQQILSDLLPLPLTCQASRTIIATGIPYEFLDLPLHIKNYIRQHDKHAQTPSF